MKKNITELAKLKIRNLNIKKKCLNCEKEFIPTQHLFRQKFCSKKCQEELWKGNHPETRKKYILKYRSQSHHMEKINDTQRQYRRKLFKTNLNYIISTRIATQLRRTLERYTKTGKLLSSSYYGIDYVAIVKKLTPLPFPLEDKGNWHIDHIIPVSKFNLTNSEEVKRAFSPNNLQWLSAKENWIKNNRIK